MKNSLSNREFGKRPAETFWAPSASVEELRRSNAGGYVLESTRGAGSMIGDNPSLGISALRMRENRSVDLDRSCHRRARRLFSRWSIKRLRPGV